MKSRDRGTVPPVSRLSAVLTADAGTVGDRTRGRALSRAEVNLAHLVA